MYRNRDYTFEDYLNGEAGRMRESRYRESRRAYGSRSRMDEALGRAWRDKATVGGRQIRIGDFTAYVCFSIMEAIDGRGVDLWTLAQLQDYFSAPGPVRAAGVTYSQMRNIAAKAFAGQNPDEVIWNFMNNPADPAFRGILTELVYGLTNACKLVRKEVAAPGTDDDAAAVCAIRCMERFGKAPRVRNLLKNYPRLGFSWPKPMEFDYDDYED